MKKIKKNNFNEAVTGTLLEYLFSNEHIKNVLKITKAFFTIHTLYIMYYINILFSCIVSLIQQDQRWLIENQH